MNVENILSNGGHEEIFLRGGGGKSGEISFTHSELRKQLFFLKLSKSRGVLSPPPSDAHGPGSDANFASTPSFLRRATSASSCTASRNTTFRFAFWRRRWKFTSSITARRVSKLRWGEITGKGALYKIRNEWESLSMFLVWGSGNTSNCKFLTKPHFLWISASKPNAGHQDRRNDKKNY